MKRVCRAALAASLSLAPVRAQSALPATTKWEVNLTWIAPASSPDPVAGYNVLRAPESSGAYAQINATELAPTALAYTDLAVGEGQNYQYIVESVDAQGNSSVPSNTAVVVVPGLPAATITGNTT